MEVVKIQFYLSSFLQETHPHFVVIASIFSTSIFYRFSHRRLLYLVCKFYGNYFQNAILSDPGKRVYKIYNYVSILRILFKLHVFLKLFSIIGIHRKSFLKML